MKIRRLYLKAYGPFTERWLDFTNSPGMTIIYGKNEAGKSSTLRALHGFFFGIEHNSADSFVHEYTKMRIGAVLETADGHVHGLMRRKARNKTLFKMNPDTGEELTDQPVEESFLSGLLGGLDANLYRALFGLDLQNLVEGSEELLSGQGEIGASLFQATAGLGNLQTLGSKLAGEAAELFKPGGSNPPVNKALKEIDDKRGRVKDLGVKTSAWQEKAKALEHAQAEYDAVVTHVNALVQEQTLLNQVNVCLPLASERTEVLKRLDELKDTPLLSLDFTERRINAQAAWRAAETARLKAAGNIARLEQYLENLQVNQGVLDQASRIETLFHRVKPFLDARRRVPELDREILKLGENISIALQHMGIEATEPNLQQLGPSATLRAKVNALISDYQTLRARTEATQKQTRTAEDDISKANAELDQLPAAESVESLEGLHHDITRRGDLEKRVADAHRQRDEQQTKVERGAQLLWSGTVEDLSRLQLPEVATLDDFLARFAAIEQALRDLKTDDTKQEKDTAALKLAQNSLAAGGDVVTTNQVLAARERRDTGWQLIQQAYIDGTKDAGQLAADYGVSGSLPEAFEQEVLRSDQLADRRYQEAERSTKFEENALRIAQMHAAKEHNASQRETLLAEQAKLQQRWESTIAQLQRPTLMPAAAKEWCQGQRSWREQYDVLSSHVANLKEAEAELESARAQLDQALRQAGLDPLQGGEGLPAGLNRVRQHIQKVTNAANSRRVQEAALTRAQSSRDASKRELLSHQEQAAELRTGWSSAMAALRLSVDALPDEARARLIEFDQLRELQQERQGLKDDLKGLRILQEEFVEDSRDLLATLGQGEGTPDSDIATRIEALHETLREQREAAAAKDNSETALSRERDNLHACERESYAQAVTLLELKDTAKTTSEGQLPDIEARATEKQLAEQELQKLNRQVANAAALSLDQALSLVAGHNSVSVSARLTALQEEKRQLDERRELAFRALGAAETELKLIDGGAAAADAQEYLQSTLARTSRGIRDYLRLKLSQAVVTNVVNAYREKHQGPVLARASEIFSEMTKGSFERLTTDFEGDTQVMLGLRPDGTRVPIKGLSTGTRDQLFLSLRLAGIEEHLKTRESIPLVIDDLLVQFDVERTGAALAQLSDLASKTQVIFFTHHRHVLDESTPSVNSGVCKHVWLEP